MRRLATRWLPWFVLLFAACGGSSGPPPAQDGGADAGVVVVKPLSVVTWNVRNFFDWVDDPAGDDTVLSISSYTNKRQAVGAVLRTINADVVVLQEIENEVTAKELIARELSSMSYGPPVVSRGNDNRLINIAVFSRYPVVSVVSHKNDTFKNPNTGRFFNFARDCLEVELDVEGVRWVIYGVHFISQLADSDERRFAEAAHVRSLLDFRLAANPNARLVVAGDLNDTPGTSPVTRLLGLGDTAMIDATLSVILSRRYTFVFNGANRQYDYILASRGTGVGTATADIIHNNGVTDASDHRPVFVQFPGGG